MVIIYKKTGIFVICYLLYFVFLMMAVSGCDKAASRSLKSPYTEFSHISFREVPEVTTDEIATIEALIQQKASFVYGADFSNYTIIDGNGRISGFTALFCDWLTNFFGIPFIPSVYTWDNLIAKLENHEIDFTGELTPTDERRMTYFMTDPIAESTIKYFRIVNSEPLSEIIQSRPLRYAFTEGTTVFDNVRYTLVPYTYEVIFINSTIEAYDLLKSGKVDAFIGQSFIEAVFDPYDDVFVSDYYPLTFQSISLTTQNPDLEPIISIVQKMLRNGGIYYLTELYDTGYYDYLKNKLLRQLTVEERLYIQNHPVIHFAAESGNYPVSFYNTRENQWQGIAFEVLHEMELLTDLRFVHNNDANASFSDQLKMLEDGKVSMITELIYSDIRAPRFLWSDATFMIDNPILISRSDYRNINVNEIMYIKIGLVKDYALTDLFRSWFPHHSNSIEYESTLSSLDALDRGEVDMVMNSNHELLIMTNYLERIGYKANLVFDYPFRSTFGFNRDEADLKSIIDKAMRLINTDVISNQWMRKTYDYRIKVAEARMPWLIGAITLALCVVALIFILFQRGRKHSRNLENQVRIRTAELKAVIDNYKGVIWSVDPKKLITIFGGQYLEKIKLKASYILGKNLEEARLKNRHLDIIEHVDKTLKEGAQEWISEIDGTLFHSCTTPVYDKAGNIISIVGSNDDMTELITIQRNLEKSYFLAAMSHEIRTPMNAIIGMTSIGKSSENIERKDYALDKIGDAAVHLLGVINDILDLSIIEANKLELSPVEFDIEKILKKIANIINFRMDEKHQHFTLNIDKKIPRFLIGDEHHLSQVILNLLSNAAKFSPENSEIGLDVSLADEKDHICLLRMEVYDHGIGISPEQQTKLFRAFEQGDSSLNRKFGGTGLGLSISKHIVELMGGTIWVESEMGKGSRFIFTVKIERGVDNANSMPASGLKPGIDANNRFIGKKLLIADDVEINREILISLLNDTGISIDCAQNGIEAVKMVTDAPDKYDAVLMDIQMPKLDGLEATRRIRGLTTVSKEKLPIIAMTAHVFKSDIEKCLSAGMNDHIGKPFDIDDVLNKLYIYLYEPGKLGSGE